MSFSDQDLIDRAVRRRDQRAFEQLVLRYQSRVRSWTRRLSNGDWATADDIAQEAFLKAYMALPAFRGDASFPVWLYRIVFNVAASRWRGKERLTSLEETGDDAANDEQLVLTCRDDIEGAMAQLSEPQRIAIQLCYQDGFSHLEASTIMGIPLGTLKTHVNRGKMKLQRLLSDWRLR